MNKSKPLSDISVQFMKGVGPARARLLMNLGVETIEDLLYLFPRRYEDRRKLTPIAQAEVGQTQAVWGTIGALKSRRSYYTKKHLSEITIDDATGRLVCVWFNQPYLENYFKPGKKVVCYGKVDIYKNRLQMVSPEYEVIEDEDDEDSLSIRRIVPIYPLTRGMSQRYLRRMMRAALDTYSEGLADELPVDLRNTHRLANIRRSIHSVHFPADFEEQEEAMRRLSFEEFYFFQISLMLRRRSIIDKPGISHGISNSLVMSCIDAFPFKLTGAQQRAVVSIQKDMNAGKPMLRLLQGDVGSGKTAIAFLGCLMAAGCGHQAAIMAPTEILARQHYLNLRKLCERDSLKHLRIELCVSGLNKRERDELKAGIKSGGTNIVIGTHALISEDVEFKNLSFVVIDEQHKFGVRQRALLSQKGQNPDVLIMTATPIPRTLCITLYGDLDLSVIDEMPPGRGKVATTFTSEEEAAGVYEFLRRKLGEGRQAYVVYPIIAESETLDLKAAESMYKHFQKNEFKGFRLGLAHGQMKREDVNAVMEDFRSGKIDLLVATTMLEVGLDVPNATVMAIEHAQRFGLAQLHQLRGRIGRGGVDSFCLLIGDDTTPGARARIDAMLETTDGFKIAQKDLELRGPGQFFGRHQHGLNELAVINPVKQMDILELARKEAQKLVEGDNMLHDHGALLNVVRRRYPAYLANVEAG